MAQNICFYSNKCEWSKAFLKEIAQTSFKTKFSYICIDKDASGRRPNLPEWLKKVPTLVIKGDTEPIKTDAEVMNWLFNEKMKNSSPGNGGGTQGGGPQALEADPEPWMNQEMSSGLKDAYSFIEEGAASFISRSFETIAGPGTRTGSEMPATSRQSDKKSQKEELFDKQMESFMKNREMGVPQQRPRQ